MLLIFVCASFAVASERFKDGLVPISKFEVSAPATGRYAPWRDPKDQIQYYGGEIIVVRDASFQYVVFSDYLGRPLPDYSGPLMTFKDHVYLDHPGVRLPYRVAGIADGVSVLVTWAGYEEWKKTGKIFELDILYLEKEEKKEPNQASEPTPPSVTDRAAARSAPAGGVAHL